MSTGILALVGFIMVATIVWGLIQSKITPIPVFVIVSITAALVVMVPDAIMNGAPLSELFTFIKNGVGKTMPIAVLFIFSIIYFCIMNDVGMFDPLVNALVKMAKTNVILVTVATAIIAILGHLDGALASTLLITVPAMLPIYKRLNMRPLTLLVIIGAAMSIMNLLPWGGPVARTATITGMDINQLWQDLIPMQVVCCILVIGFAAFMGAVEKRRGAGLSATGNTDDAAGIEAEVIDPKIAALKRPHLVWFNILLTLGVIGLLCFTKIPLYAAFLIGLSIALVVNFPNAKDQTARIKAHAAEALPMASILLASGVFLGVLSGTKMIDAMATTMINIIPDFLGPYLHVIMGIFSVPIGMVLGTDSFFFGLVPLAMEVGAKFGIDPNNMAKWMLIGKNFGVLVTPHAATTFLAIGLAGVELKDHLKFCTIWLWGLSLITLFVGVLMGTIYL